MSSSVIGAVLSNPALIPQTQQGPIYVATGQGSVTSTNIDGSAFVVTERVLAVTVTGSAATNQIIAGNDVTGTTINTTTGTGTVIAGNASTQVGLVGDQNGNGGSYVVYGGPQNDTVLASSGSNTITGGAGSNVFGLAGGNNAVYAAGNDTVFATGGTNLIGGGTGNSTIVASSGTNTIFGGNGTSNIFAQGGQSTVFAGSGVNQVFGIDNNALYAVGGSSSTNTATIVGGNANDTLFGGTGKSVMFGGGGENLFAFSTVFGGGQTVIGDFNASGANNKILIQGYSGVTSASLLSNATVTGGNTVITLTDNTTITVAGVTNLSQNSIIVQ
ncbi:hypothetical protein TSH64_28155 [Azospirillum sp. TSH64]|nr:hypothetical protein TSH64_28155 [Azospirillum sp. TSH64]